MMKAITKKLILMVMFTVRMGSVINQCGLK